MRKSTKILGALAVAGLVAVGGSAFTAPGLTNSAGPDNFVGGTISQTVSGATLTSVVYGFTDTTNTAIDTVTLTFGSSAATKTAAIVFAGSAALFTCPDPITGPVTFTTVCTPVTVPATGVTGADISVS